MIFNEYIWEFISGEAFFFYFYRDVVVYDSFKGVFSDLEVYVVFIILYWFLGI